VELRPNRAVNISYCGGSDEISQRGRRTPKPWSNKKATRYYRKLSLHHVDFDHTQHRKTLDRWIRVKSAVGFSGIRNSLVYTVCSDHAATCAHGGTSMSRGSVVTKLDVGPEADDRSLYELPRQPRRYRRPSQAANSPASAVETL
jgi:hypothetical protein